MISPGRVGWKEAHTNSLYNMENSVVANFLCNCYEILESAGRVDSFLIDTVRFMHMPSKVINTYNIYV